MRLHLFPINCPMVQCQSCLIVESVLPSEVFVPLETNNIFDRMTGRNPFRVPGEHASLNDECRLSEGKIGGCTDAHALPTRNSTL